MIKKKKEFNGEFIILMAAVFTVLILVFCPKQHNTDSIENIVETVVIQAVAPDCAIAERPNGEYITIKGTAFKEGQVWHVTLKKGKTIEEDKVVDCWK